MPIKAYIVRNACMPKVVYRADRPTGLHKSIYTVNAPLTLTNLHANFFGLAFLSNTLWATEIWIQVDPWIHADE